VAVGIGHDHPADLAQGDVDVSRAEGQKPVDLSLLIAVDRRSDVDV
jgi:hypothetical protein